MDAGTGEERGPADPPPIPPARLTEPTVTSLAFETGMSLEEAAQRMGWQSAAIPVIPKVKAALGSRFGGAWFDMESSRLQIGIVADGPPPSAAELEPIQSAGLAGITDVHAVSWSISELNRVLRRLSTELSRATSVGRPSAVLMLGRRDGMNAVEITVPSEPLPAPQQELVDRAVETYGSRILVVQGTGDGYASTDPLVYDPELRRRLSEQDRSADQP